MQLKDLHHIDQLDTEIASLHQKLQQLYQKRSALVMPNQVALQSIAGQYSQTFSQADSTEALYQHLVQTWAQREIKVPAFRTLKARLEKVKASQARLATKYPELQGQLRVVLVPPKANLAKLLSKDHSEGQQQIVLEGELTDTSKWSLVLIYASAEGLELNHPTTHDKQLQALGVNEYIALVAQEELLIDEQQWTVLLKGKSKHDQTAPCVKFTNQAYHFMTDEIDSIFNDNGFRPAMELN